MCLNGTYPFLSATLVRQLPYYLFRETCFMDSYPRGLLFVIYDQEKKSTGDCTKSGNAQSAQYAHNAACQQNAAHAGQNAFLEIHIQ